MAIEIKEKCCCGAEFYIKDSVVFGNCAEKQYNDFVKQHSICRNKKSTNNHLKFVVSMNRDWAVLYFNDDKIWEDDIWNSSLIESVSKAIDAEFDEYEFTDEDEIDGFTPDKFSDIIGIEKIE